MSRRHEKKLLAKRRQHNADQKAKRKAGEKPMPRPKRKQPRKGK